MKKFFGKAYFYIVLLFLYLPIITLVVFSFNKAKSRGKWGGFSLHWYEKLFDNSQMMDALATTVIIAVLAAVISTLIGTVSAIALHNCTPRVRKPMLNVTYTVEAADQVKQCGFTGSAGAHQGDELASSDFELRAV